MNLLNCFGPGVVRRNEDLDEGCLDGIRLKVLLVISAKNNFKRLLFQIIWKTIKFR